MRTAYEHGFDVITLTDCVAGTSLEEHNNAIELDYPMFSTPTTSTDLAGRRSRTQSPQCAASEA